MPSVKDLYDQAQTLRLTERDADPSTLTDLSENWKSADIPVLQSKVSDYQMARFRDGEVDPVFQSLIDILGVLPEPPKTIIDAACATGYYSEVIERVLPDASYLGSDYSSAMVDTARLHYPRRHFEIQDATKLSFADRAFDCVLLSGALEHIPEYGTAISEICRAASKFVVLHRLPTVRGGEIRHTVGSQYSIVTPRIYYTRSFIRRVFRREGFVKIADIPTYARSRREALRMLVRRGEPDIRTMAFKRIRA
jgi:ubiquinone/menaquinone biosynthesis C-methylase UbiE